jgi:glycosyltransferase involved in cell wall biosynthesis
MPARADARLAVIIPAYEAAATVAEVVTAARAAAPGAPIYVVDDGSRDTTGPRAAGAGATVLGHLHNRGKGAALATGIARALADQADVLVTLDADGQHPAGEIPRVAAAVLAGSADLVLGARARAGAMPLSRRLTNWLSAALASRIGGAAVVDAQTGFRAISRALADAVRPSQTGYDFETAFLLAALAGGYRVQTAPIPTIYRGARSHFRHWRDTWRQARVFARYGRHILFGAR